MANAEQLLNELNERVQDRRTQEQAQLCLALLESDIKELRWEDFMDVDALSFLIDDPQSEVRHLMSKVTEWSMELDAHSSKFVSWDVWDAMARHEAHEQFLMSRIANYEARLLTMLRTELERIYP